MTAQHPMKPLPKNIEKYFWDCDFETMNMQQHAFFICERILTYGNEDSIRWLRAAIDQALLKKVISQSRNLDKKTKNYWKVMLNE